MTTEELETILQDLKIVIQERKQQANNSKLPGKIQKVAETYGEKSDWGGGTYYYHGNTFRIEYCFHDAYLNANIKEGKEVFSGKLHQNGVADIYLYIPGDWEKELEEVYKKIPYVIEKREIKKLQSEINELKKKWELEE